MAYNLTIIAAEQDRLTKQDITALRDILQQTGCDSENPLWLHPEQACDIAFTSEQALPLGQPPASSAENAGLVLTALHKNIGAYCQKRCMDYALLPQQNRQKKLLLADMDSTIITGESLDEIGELVGKGSEIACLTQEAMEGKLSFTDALTARLKLLAGQPSTLIARVYHSLSYTAGAQTLIHTMKKQGAFCYLVSGGFQPIIDRVVETLGFDAGFGNQFEIQDGHLTGRAVPPIRDRHYKLEVLQEKLRTHKLSAFDSLAVGDGANDLAMIKAAGLGVAFHGKPVVVEAAPVAIRYHNLTALLYFQGYPKSAWSLGSDD